MKKFCPDCKKEDIFNELEHLEDIDLYYCDRCDGKFSEEKIDNGT